MEISSNWRWICLVVGLLSASSPLSVVGQVSPYGVNCRIERRIVDLQPCLNEIYTLASNDTVFWFGKGLDQTCSQDAMRNPDDTNCFVGSDGSRKTTVFDRLFSVDPGTTGFSKYLTVTYASPEGNYTACGGNFSMPRRTVDAQPDSQPPVQPWFVRNQPVFNFPAEPNVQYTIMIADGAFGYVLGVISHYPLNQDTYSYQPPVNAYNHTTPIVYLVFKEASSAPISDRWQQAFGKSNRERSPFDFSQFIRDNQLEGPIAMNILPITNDLYSADMLVSQNGPNVCPQFVGEALQAAGEVFINRIDRTQMDMMLTLTFVSPPATFSVCCKSYVYTDAQTVVIHPLMDTHIDPMMVRNPPTVTAQRTTKTSSGNRLFTIIAVDPTIPKNALSTTFRPYLVWMAVNLAENQLGVADLRGNKTIIVSYEAIIPPPQSPPRTVYFFLFEQPDRLDLDSADMRNFAQRYSDPLCNDYLLGRCLFRINDYIQDKRLILRAASWMILVNDAYARYWLVKSGQVEWDICSGQPGYSVPCPRPGEYQLSRPGRVTESGAERPNVLCLLTLFIIPVLRILTTM